MGGNLTALKLLPPWPLSPDKAAGPVIVIGEVHHTVKAVIVLAATVQVVGRDLVTADIAESRPSRAVNVSLSIQQLIADHLHHSLH